MRSRKRRSRRRGVTSGAGVREATRAEKLDALLAGASARFPLYAFTNSNPSHQADWSKRFAEELEVFTATFVSSDLGLGKPEREAVAAKIDVPASRILFFDDRHENVVGALEAGMQAVQVTSTDSVRAALFELGVEFPPPISRFPFDERRVHRAGDDALIRTTADTR